MNTQKKHEYLLLLAIVILLHNIFGLSNIIYFVRERFMAEVVKTMNRGRARVMKGK